MRVGFAKDIHRLVEGKDLILGGVKIPFDKCLEAHSDGDVVIHSIVDALIGALNKGDIGTLFPDTDERYKNINSSYFLKEIKKIIENCSVFIDYIDVFISCEKPKLKDYISQMKENICKELQISTDRLSIKCGTNEGVGAVGEGKTIESYCIVCLGEKL